MDRGVMFAALSATNEAILRSKSSSELYQKVCDAAVVLGALILEHATIGSRKTAARRAYRSI